MKARVVLLSVLLGLALAGGIVLGLRQGAEAQGSLAPQEAVDAAFAYQDRLFSADGVHDSSEGVLSPMAAPADAGQAQAAVLTWQTETVDIVGDVPGFNSLVLDMEDHPHVGYQYLGLGGTALRYVYHDGSTWITETVESAAEVGLYVSLALDSSGLPHIGYCQPVYAENVVYIKYAYYNGSTWITETVHSAGEESGYVSLALDSDDRPHISYYDGSGGDLEYVYDNGYDWITDTVDSAGNVGQHTSLALDGDDHIHISYYDVISDDLRYAYYDGLDWITEPVDSVGEVGAYTSLALDSDGRPHISYYEVVSHNLRYAHYDGSGWITETVVEDTGIWMYTSLALDAAGLPHVAYQDQDGPRYTYKLSDTWTIETVDSGWNVGHHPFLALDSVGLPHVSYSDQPRGSLKYAEYDLTPPTIISGPNVISITQNSAAVVWQTDEDSDSVVQYGSQAGTYNLDAQNTSLVREHNLTLIGLDPSTVYHYVVQSTDVASNAVVSGEGFFETAPVSDSVPPAASSLTFTPGDGMFQYYTIGAPVSDTVGVERVMFYMDDELIGTDYSSSDSDYEFYLDPFVRGMSREDFYATHTLRLDAYDRFGLKSVYEETVMPFEEPMEGELIIESPDPGYTLYIEGSVVPPESRVGVLVYAVEYEWECIVDRLLTIIEEPHETPNWPVGHQVNRVASPASPAGNGTLPYPVSGTPRFGHQVDRAVERVVFYIDDTPVSTSTPSSESSFYHSFSWDVSGLTPGTYEIGVRAYDSAGKYLHRIRPVEIAQGQAGIVVTRTVSRIDNYFEVSLTVANHGPNYKDVSQISDNLYGFQPIRKSTPFGEYPDYQVTTQCWSDAVRCDVEIGVNSSGAGIDPLPPGRDFTVKYLAVPVLYPPFHSWQYAIGAAPIVVSYDDSTGHHEKEFERPCYSTVEGEVNPVYWAKELSDYLIVTNPFWLGVHTGTGDDLQHLLSTLGKLAQLKNGILAYPYGPDAMDPNQIEAWITYWGTGMRGSDGTPNGFLSNGYLLIVGESEVVPSWHQCGFNINWSNAPTTHDVDLTDLPYADTGGSGAPELILGRIVGDIADDIREAVETSIGVYEGWSGYNFQRYGALLVSGRGCCQNTFVNNVNDIGGILPGKGFDIVTKIHWKDYTTDTTRIAAFKSNALDKDAIYATAHGNSDCFGPFCSWHLWDIDFGTHKPLMFASSCWTGFYEGGDDFNLAEAFLRKGTGVYLGATQVSPVNQNAAAGELFFNGWDVNESIGKAFNDLERNRWGQSSMWNFWVWEYNLYGDPKYGAIPPIGVSEASAPAKPQQPPTSSLQIEIPDYVVSTTEGLDYVEIPGGDLLLVKDKPQVPYWSVSLDYPQGYQVQDVALTDRSGLIVTTGLTLPATYVGIACSCDASSRTSSNQGQGWFPEEDYRWDVQQNVDGSSILTIIMYPFYYNPATTDARFYQDYSFDIHYISSTVGVELLTTDEDVYAQGDEVAVDLWVSNSGDAQDVIVDAVVKVEGSDEVVDGLLLRSLKGLTGLASFSSQWDSSDFGPGHYAVEAEVRDADGNLLDSATEEFRMGICAGEIVTLTATPRLFDAGEPVSVSLTFSNTGTIPITGTAIIEVQDKDGEVVQEFRHDLAGVAPASAVSFDDVWDTSEAAEGSYVVAGYALYDAKTTSPVGVLVTARARVYLPVVIRES